MSSPLCSPLGAHGSEGDLPACAFPGTRMADVQDIHKFPVPDHCYIAMSPPFQAYLCEHPAFSLLSQPYPKFS